MKRIISALALLTAATFSAAGCGGDDDDSSSSTAGKGNTGGEPATNTGGQPAANGGDSSTPAGGASSGNVMCDETQDGVCQNPTDCPSVASGAARLSSGKCGQDCLKSGSKDPNCARDCIVMDTSMTNECASCYAGVVACATKNCLNECITDPTSAECTACQVEKGCRSTFDECSGLTE
jgi:hypothetical protein